MNSPPSQPMRTGVGVMLTNAERAYDHYVTVEQPGSWNEGYRDRYAGAPFDDSNQASELAYKQGYDAARIVEGNRASTTDQEVPSL